jgi:imidazolonepropionase-like amidohydrolase
VTFKRALLARVTIACGSDVGVFRHGDNAREIELMVDYGMTPAQALQAATSVAAKVLGRERELGRMDAGYVADLVAVAGDPLKDPKALRQTRMVVQGGRLVVDRRPPRAR